MNRQPRNGARGDSHARHGPVPISEVLSKLLSRTGYAHGQQAVELRRVWNAVVGKQFAHRTRPGVLRRGVLEIFVANSSLLQELSFQKHQLLSQLVKQLPQKSLTDIRFRIGQIESNQES